MAIRKIVTFGDDVLEKKCREVEKFDKKLHQLLEDMKQTLKEVNGVGLAAPQVGMLKRVCIVDVDGLIEMVNPQIIETEGMQEGAEGCLSNPGEYGIVQRPNFVKIKAQDRHGNWFEAEGEGLTARAFCHELDHLDGVLFITKVTRMLDPEELENAD